MLNKCYTKGLEGKEMKKEMHNKICLIRALREIDVI